MVGVVRLSCPYAYMVKTTRLKAVETCTSNGFTRKNRNENPKPRKWGRTIMTPAALNNGRLDMNYLERLNTVYDFYRGIKLQEDVLVGALKTEVYEYMKLHPKLNLDVDQEVNDFLKEKKHG